MKLIHKIFIFFKHKQAVVSELKFRVLFCSSLAPLSESRCDYMLSGLVIPVTK